MSRLSDPLIRAWLWLGGLSLASAAAAQFGGAAPKGVVGVVVLVFATFKARLILDRYLGLDEAPFWRRGFAVAIVGFMLLLGVLHLAA